jgi:hypothetical protein
MTAIPKHLPPATGGQPYLGLNSFTEDDAGWFFGPRIAAAASLPAG